MCAVKDKNYHIEDLDSQSSIEEEEEEEEEEEISSEGHLIWDLWYFRDQR